MVPLEVDQDQIPITVIDHPQLNDRGCGLTVFINNDLKIKIAGTAYEEFIAAIAIDFIDMICAARNKDSLVLLGNWPTPPYH